MSTQTAKNVAGDTVHTQGSGSGADTNNGFMAAHGAVMLLASVEVTRPADTTAYAVNDMLGLTANWEAVVAREASGTAILTAVEFATDQTTCVARVELDFYSAAITSIADNAEATRLYANQASHLGPGPVTLPAMAKKSTNSTQADAATTCDVALQADASKKVYWTTRTLDIFTPASGQKFRINLYGYMN